MSAWANTHLVNEAGSVGQAARDPLPGLFGSRIAVLTIMITSSISISISIISIIILMTITMYHYYPHWTITASNIMNIDIMILTHNHEVRKICTRDATSL